MYKRTKLRVVAGNQIEYFSTDKNDVRQRGICSLEEWRAWEIQYQLVEAGVNEKLVKELYELGYSIGHDSAEQDHAERDAGESL